MDKYDNERLNLHGTYIQSILKRLEAVEKRMPMEFKDLTQYHKWPDGTYSLQSPSTPSVAPTVQEKPIPLSVKQVEDAFMVFRKDKCTFPPDEYTADLRQAYYAGYRLAESYLLTTSK